MDGIAWFDRYDPAQRVLVGGKNAALGALTVAGFPVPPGFAVTASAYREAVRSAGLTTRLAALAAGIDAADTDRIGEVGSAARDAIRRAGLPDWLHAQVAHAYLVLSERCDESEVPVAVRSSATCEDQPDASYAGAHDTYLGVRSASQLTEHVLRCWASLYTDRAIAYRGRLGQPESVAMSVGVQRMIRARTAGVAFTLDPVDGNRSLVAVEASWGLGDAVVGGVVTPDRYLVDKTTGDITRRTVAGKLVEHRLGADGTVVRVAVDDARQHVACLVDDEVQAVARLAVLTERHHGRPQDVEWAIETADGSRAASVVVPAPPGDATVWLLQSRPETVFSRESSGPRPDVRMAGIPGVPGAVLSGCAASPGVAEGIARVVLDVDGIAAVQSGEILVAPATTPTWLAVFGRIAAVVTDTGGVTSHAAIVCREYRLPAVTSTATGSTVIRTGIRLRVDGNTGHVTVLAS